MCKGVDLDAHQKAALKACIEESLQPQRSFFARFRTGLTMLVIGMHSSSNRVPASGNERDRLF